MMGYSESSRLHTWARLSKACGIIVIGFGVIALLGWLTGLPLLASLGPGNKPMAPSSALIFIAYGTAFFLHARDTRDRTTRRVMAALGAFGTIASLSLLLCALFGLRLSVERLGMEIEGTMAGAPVGHMSPLTAFCFLLYGVSFLLLLFSSPRRPWNAIASFLLALFSLLIGMILTIAYMLGGPLLYGSGVIPPAFPTSLAFLAFGVGLLFNAGLAARPSGDYSNASSLRMASPLVLIFILATTGIVAAGYFSFHNYHKLFRSEMERQLSTIADLKISELIQWRKERLGDAEVFYNNAGFSDLVKQFFENPADGNARGQIHMWLDKVRNAYNYDRTFLLDARGVERLSVPSTNDGSSPYLVKNALETMRSGRIEFLDFYQVSSGGPIYLAVLVPIFDGPDSQSPLGALCLLIDPETYLYPLIMRWPTFSKTAETLLVRREGSQALFLNELRFRDRTALNFRSSPDNPTLPALKAVMGHQGVTEGLDYRGVPVVAFTRAVPHSPWFLVARMDAAEVYAPLQERLWGTLTLIGALLFGAAAVLGLLWRDQRLRFYQERYEAAEALRESESRYKDLYENAPDMYLSVDPLTAIVTRCNLTLARSTGYKKEEILGQPVFNLCHPDCMDAAKEIFKTFADRGFMKDAELQLRRKDGGIIEISLNGSVERDPSGAILQCQFNWRDITDRKRAERRIERLNSVLRAIRDVNQLIVREKDREQLILKGVRLLVESGSYAGAIFALTDDDDRLENYSIAGMDEGLQIFVEMLDRGELPPCCLEATKARDILILPDREDFCLDCRVIKSCDMGIMCVRLVHDDIGFGYIIVAVKDRPETDAEDRELFAEMAGDMAYALYVMKSQEAMELAEQERQSLEDQLLQSQKMEAIGRLAGGVAHDFNNMLQTILGYSDLVLEKTSRDDPFREHFEEIQKAALRSADLTRQLLAFSRKQTIAPHVLDLNETIASMLKMLGRLIGEDIDLLWRPTQDLWQVKMDPAQIDQILANLVVNARDAIRGVGKITIETNKAEFDRAYCDTHAGFVPGRYVMLAVSDDGMGMDKETLSLVFEPFFTTKPRGQGTGLGLATVYGIVKQNNGFINVYSEQGKGTTFRIYFSAHEAEPRVEVKADHSEKPSGTETILVVEDEESLLQLNIKMLEQLGYTVLPANSPSKAILLAEQYDGAIHLLLTDVILPEMSGRDLWRRLNEIRPDLKCLYMSGYTANVITHHGVLDQDVHFLQKPFSRRDLADKIREALEI